MPRGGNDNGVGEPEASPLQNDNGACSGRLARIAQEALRPEARLVAALGHQLSAAIPCPHIRLVVAQLLAEVLLVMSSSISSQVCGLYFLTSSTWARPREYEFTTSSQETKIIPVIGSRQASRSHTCRTWVRSR